MPRHSPYAIDLSDEERQALDARARAYTSPYCEVIRDKIVLLAAEGLRNDEIANRLGTPRQVVSAGKRATRRGGSTSKHTPTPLSDWRAKRLARCALA